MNMGRGAVGLKAAHVDLRAGRRLPVRLLERFQEIEPVVLAHQARNAVATLFQIDGVDPRQAAVLLVGAHQLNLAVVHVVEGDGPEDVVHHGIA